MGFSKPTYYGQTAGNAPHPTNNNNSRQVAAVEIKQAPQPVLGSFADLWEMRQTSDILLEDTTDKKLYEEGEEQQVAPCYDPHTGYYVHPMRVTTHNPYSLSDPIYSVYMCHCEACQSMGSSQSDGSEQCLYREQVIIEQVPQPQPEQLVEEPVSVFMPPPPPRLDTADVLAACECPDAVELVFSMMQRWYVRAARAQSYFVAEADFSPAPTEGATTEDHVEWCRSINQWWYNHFEHRQKKQFVPRAHQGHNGYW
jgi:hypothetical protein